MPLKRVAWEAMGARTDRESLEGDRVSKMCKALLKARVLDTGLSGLGRSHSAAEGWAQFARRMRQSLAKLHGCASRGEHCSVGSLAVTPGCQALQGGG